MEAKEIVERLTSALPDASVQLNTETVDPWIAIHPGSVRAVLQTLRDGEGLDFDLLQLVTGIDRVERFEVVYHVGSVKHGHRIAIKAFIDRDDPHIDSVADLYPAANWHERETYDLLGIIFNSHPDLRRILLPEDWEGHPLRKDYVDPEEYHGVSHKEKG